MQFNFINTSKNNHLIYDIESIKKIQFYIEEALNSSDIKTILSQFSLNIDYKVTNTNKINQLYNYFISKETIAYAYKSETPLITISTDVLKFFDSHNIEAFLKQSPGEIDYLNHCRIAFPQSKDNPVQKLMIQSFFFHELGHIILDHKLPELSIFIEKNQKNNRLTCQSIQNIEEGFSDLFSCFIMNKLYPDLNLVNSYRAVRNNFSLYNNKEKEIDIYNIANNFNFLSKINSHNLFNTIFQIAEKNAYNLLVETSDNPKDILTYQDLTKRIIILPKILENRKKSTILNKYNNFSIN